MTTEDSNELIPLAIDLLKNLVASYTGVYGNAVLIDGVITSTAKDNEDNYTALTALVTTKIDLNRPPEILPRKEVMVTDIVLSISLELKKGISMDAFIVNNPDYFRFQEDQDGLKDVVNYLLTHDEEARTVVKSLVMRLDYVASQIVEMEKTVGQFILSTYSHGSIQNSQRQ